MILKSSVTAILRAITDTVWFGTKFSGGQNFFLFKLEVFFPTRESTLGLTGWTFSYPSFVRCETVRDPLDSEMVWNDGLKKPNTARKKVM